MSEAASPAGRRRPAAQGWSARAKQWLLRAAGADSHERGAMALIGKSVLAATLAWYLAHDVIAAQSPAFAPFSAVLIMQVTVYQSFLQALRYVAAVAAGVAVQGALAFLAGPDLLTFTLVAFIAVTIGRWRKLGVQGSQVATAAFFAFSTFAATSGDMSRINHLGQIILLVLIGCGVGTVVNVLVLPPMRYRNAEYGIRALAHSLCDLLSDVYPSLREEPLQAERTERWRRRANHLVPLTSQARTSLRTARESTYYNPRRLLGRRRHRNNGFSGYEAVVDALERITHQMSSLTRSMDQWHDGEGGEGYRYFLRRYGDFLAHLAPPPSSSVA